MTNTVSHSVRAGAMHQPLLTPRSPPLLGTRLIGRRSTPAGHLLPSVYLLIGDELSAREEVQMLRRAAELVRNRVIPPFLAVALPKLDCYELSNAVAYVDANFPTLREPRGRTLIGVGGPAVETLASGIQSASLFGVLEAWNSAPCDPCLPRLFALLHEQAKPNLTQRVFLSTASFDARDEAVSIEIADELSRTRRPYAHWSGPRSSAAPWWLPQLPRALSFALRGAPWPA